MKETLKQKVANYFFFILVWFLQKKEGSKRSTIWRTR